MTSSNMADRCSSLKNRSDIRPGLLRVMSCLVFDSTITTSSLTRTPGRLLLGDAIALSLSLPESYVKDGTSSDGEILESRI